jgi:SulP family sulfate permease
VTGLAVLAVLPFAGIVSSIPTAVLAAVVIVAVAPMIRLRPIIALRRASRPQAAVAAATFALTLASAPRVERGVVAGVALAVAVHLWRELRLDIDVEARGNTLHLHPRGVVWFATAPGLEDRLVRILAEHPDTSSLVIHLDGVGRLDHSGALALRNALEFARGAGLRVSLDGTPPHARRIVGAMLEDGTNAAGPPARSTAQADRSGSAFPARSRRRRA